MIKGTSSSMFQAARCSQVRHLIIMLQAWDRRTPEDDPPREIVDVILKKLASVYGVPAHFGAPWPCMCYTTL